MTEAPLARNGKPVESVWDYPRPPRLEAVRVLETSQPPAYYIDPRFVEPFEPSLLRHRFAPFVSAASPALATATA